MKTSLLIQSPNGAPQDNLQAAVAACIDHRKFDCARVAVAYATVSGARSLLAAFDNYGLQESQWLLGLDDSLTQPGAIKLLRSLQHSTVRIASFEQSGRRFHPKFYAFARTGKPRVLSAMTGSANLTASAFHGNGEAAVLLDCTNRQDRDAVNTAWDLLWAQGREPTAEDLKAYDRMYKRRRRLHRKLDEIAAPEPGPGISLTVFPATKRRSIPLWPGLAGSNAAM